MAVNMLSLLDARAGKSGSDGGSDHADDDDGY